MKDIWGKALIDYHKGDYTEDIVTSTSISEEETLSLPYLFRSFDQMPILEQRAMKKAKGEVLDIGCGSGSHSLYLQQKGLMVHAVDTSSGAVEVARARGVKYVEELNLLHVRKQYDTLLLLMNGTGIFQEMAKLNQYLLHLKSILAPKGQILIDSSDISYMYQDEDGGIWVDMNSNYYGELEYFISYKNESEDPFKWLYLDFKTLNSKCLEVGLGCKKLMDGEHYDYLAKLYHL